jgi:pheromone shutdown-related protein TraB
VGAGHVSGIRDLLESGDFSDAIVREEIINLESVPETKAGFMQYVKYAFPLTVIGLVMLGFFMSPRDPNFLMDSALKWIITTGLLAALGVVFALGHPLSIITAFLVAPITTLHPFLAAGWFAGWVEAKVRKPLVKDFEDLLKINSIRDLWKNRVTRVLLVMGFANAGASLGAGIGLASFILNLLHIIGL